VLTVSRNELQQTTNINKYAESSLVRYVELHNSFSIAQNPDSVKRELNYLPVDQLYGTEYPQNIRFKDEARHVGISCAMGMASYSQKVTQSLAVVIDNEGSCHHSMKPATRDSSMTIILFAPCLENERAEHWGTDDLFITIV